jgi:hypothetical protein
MQWQTTLAAALLSGSLIFSAVSCDSTDSTIPDAAELDRLHAGLRTKAQYYYDRLDERKARGEISSTEYDAERDKLDGWVWEQAKDAAWRSHSLAESERRALGIPTPDSAQQISIQSSESGIGTGGGGSFYRPYSQAGSQMTGSTANPMTGSGYRPGSIAGYGR